MTKRLWWLVVDVLAALAVVSLLVYGFTGVTWWVPLTNHPGDFGRFMVLVVAHIVPPAVAALRRGMQLPPL